MGEGIGDEVNNYLLFMIVIVPVFEIIFPDGVVNFRNHKQTPWG
jgi:hypothetical protein